MFFEQGTQSSTRHRRLRYYLLFALRLALIILLALAFARPYVKHGKVLASDKLLLVVVDNSFSMKCGDGPGSTRSSGCEARAELVLADGLVAEGAGAGIGRAVGGVDAADRGQRRAAGCGGGD